MSSSGEITNLGKIEILKKGLIEERKKNAELTAQVASLKEEVILKQEVIDKQKEEIQNLKNNSSKKKLQRFITGFFDGEEDDDEEENKQEIEEEYLKKIQNLQDTINTLQNDKNFSNSKLAEALNDYNVLKTRFDNVKKETQKEYEEKLKKVQNENELKIQNFLKQISEKNQKLAEQSKSIKCMSELYKSFDIEKFNYSKQMNESKKELSEYKDKYEQQNIEIQLLHKHNEKLIKQSEDDNQEIIRLKAEIKQFKQIIDDMTPITIDYIFDGFLVSIEKKQLDQKKKLEISFGKYQNSIAFKLQQEKEKVIINKDIIDITQDKHSNNKIWLSAYIDKKQVNYLCEFTKRELEYILKFYNQIKVRNDYVEKALMNVSLSDYYY